jgi:hypothetical protein
MRTMSGTKRETKTGSVTPKGRRGKGKGKGGGRKTYLPDRRLTIFRSERTTPYTSFASSSKGKPAEAEAAPPAPPSACCTGGGGVAVDEAGTPGDWLPSANATTTPELEARVLRGLEKGVPGAEPATEMVEGGRGESACETPGRRAPPSLARFGRLARCQSW